MAAVVAEAFLPSTTNASETPVPERRSSAASTSSSINSKEIELTTVDFAPLSKTTTASSIGSQRSSVDSTRRPSNVRKSSPKPHLDTRKCNAFQAYRTLRLKTANPETLPFEHGDMSHADSVLTICDSCDRPQYVYWRSKRAATLSRVHDGVAEPTARTRYRMGFRNEADVTILSPTSPTDSGVRPSGENAVPLIVLTSDDEADEGEVTPTVSNRQSMDGSVDQDQHIKLTHAPLSSSVTKFTVPVSVQSRQHTHRDKEATTTLKWRTASSLPTPTTNTANIKSSLGLPNKSTIKTTSSTAATKTSSPVTSTTEPALLTLTQGDSYRTLARLVRQQDKSFTLTLGPEARVNGQVGWDAAGHLVDGVIDESVVVATCLVVLRRMGDGKGIV